MKPTIEKTKFGSITIEGSKLKHDILIRLGGKVEKRKKKLSKEIYGTSHTISLAEAKHVYQEGAVTLLIGTGQYDRVRLSEDAVEYFDEKGVAITLLPTGKAIQHWNKAEGNMVGLFHVTC